MAERTTTDGSPRNAGLDAWRAVLMLGGLLVHGSATLHPTQLFFAIELVSGSFRMGAFFALSGFLAAASLARHSARQWFARRLRQLGLPAMTAVLLLSPAVWALHRLRPATGAYAMPLPFEWHHSWFLWGLLICSAAACLLDRLDRRHHLIERVAGRVSAPSLLAATALATALAFALVPPVLHALLTPRLVRAYANVQLAAGYLPTFFCGFAIGRSARLRAGVLADWRRAGWGFAILLAAQALVIVAVAGPLVDHIRFVAAAAGPPAAFVLILRAVAIPRRVPRFVAPVAAASCTIYLVHLPIALAINVLMAPLRWEPYLQFVLTVVATMALSYAFHVLVVRRSAVLGLMFDGRIPARPPHPAQGDEGRPVPVLAAVPAGC